MKCPKCKSEAVSHSHRSGKLERLISRAGVYPFRCDSWRTRFFRFEFDAGDHRKTARRRDLMFYAAGLGLLMIFLYFIARG